MRERLTARVLLFDEDGRILLLKGRLPNRPKHTSSWFTVGGGVEPGETLYAAALRESPRRPVSPKGSNSAL